MIYRNKDLGIVIIFYVLLVSALLAGSLILNGGQFILALDDPYIHMTMAKNFVSHGNWATNNMDFTSASSSPLWILLLSGVYLIFGVSAAAPFILNIIFQLAAIVFAYRILKQFNVSEYLSLILTVLILVIPLMPILFVGMEHSAQIFFALLFVMLGSRLIAGVEKETNTALFLVLITPVLTGLRYESMFLVFVVSVLLLFRKKFFLSLMIFAAGALPIVIYGIISTSQGWYFLPNPILLKSSMPELTAQGLLRFFHRAYLNLTEPHIFLIMILGTFLYFFNYSKPGDFWNRKQVILLIALLTAFINMSMIEFHQNGWFYRYDAYLMAICAIALVIGFYDYLPNLLKLLKRLPGIFTKIAVVTLVIVLISPLVLRAFTFLEVPFAAKNIHDQHYQLSLFVKNHLSGIDLAANDIGMIDFYSNTGVIDLYGLANMDVAGDKLNKRYGPAEIDRITKQANIKLAIVYETGYEQYGGLPAGWQKIGEWTMTDHNFVCGYETTDFFSVDKNETENLRKLLDGFSGELPRSVIYRRY